MTRDPLQLPPSPESLSLARLPTPLRHLKKTSLATGVDIWLKCDDQTGSVLTGNKVRKLEFLLADALSKGADTIITCGGLQSNHCRATALACAQLGLGCVLLMRDGDRVVGSLAQSKGEGNLFLDYLSGASVRIIDRKEYINRLSDVFAAAEAEVKASGSVPYSIPTGGSNGIGVWGYLKAGLEISQDCERMGFAPDAIVCATGSGGTQTGLTLAAHYWPVQDEQPRILGMAVCDSAEYFRLKVMRDVESWAKSAGLSEQETASMLAALPIRTVDAYIGPGYAKSYTEVMRLIVQLAKDEGVVLDPVYTGKAFYGMLQEIKHGELKDCRNIVFVHTGGIFGLFPYASELL